jgi:molybdopterin-guanine dinucleotide biosynthesis protein A
MDQTHNTDININMSQASLIILAGGKSLRMGTNKAHLDWHAMRFIDVLVEKGKRLCFGEILLSGYDDMIEGCRTIPDMKPNRGPLGGLYSSFLASSFENALVIPVDCPGISIETMIGLSEMHLRQQNEITLLKHGNRLEPLIGMYATVFYQKILPIIEFGGAPVKRALDQGHISTYYMKENEAGILNLNTKEAYLAWMEQNENHRTNKIVASD